MSEPGFASLGPTLLARKGGAKPAMRPQLAPLVADEQQIAALADEQLEDLGWNDMGDGAEAEAPESGADVVPISAAINAADLAAAHSPIVHRQQRSLEQRVLADAAMIGPDDITEGTGDDSLYESAHEAGEADEFDYEAWTAEDTDGESDEDGYEPSYGDAFEDESEAGYEDEAEAGDYAPLAPAPAPVPVAAPAPAPVPAAPRVTARKAVRKTGRKTILAPAIASERRAAFTLRLDAERHLKLRLAATMQGVSAQALLTEALDAMLAEFDDLDVIAAHLKRH